MTLLGDPVLKVNVLNVNYVKIRNAGGGGGNEVGTVELIEGETLTVWAAGYNAGDEYVGEVTVDWSITGNNIGTLSVNNGNNTTLTATTTGVGQLLADHLTATDDSTGDITVSGIFLSGIPTWPEDEGQYSLQTTVNFKWTQGTVEDSENGIVGYYLQVGTTPEGNDKFEGSIGNVLSCGIIGCINRNTYYARVRAKDGIGLYSNWSESSDGIMVDTIGPATNIRKPAHGDTVSGIVDIIVDVSDNIKTGKIEFYINEQLSAVSNDNFSWKWDSSKYKEGKYSIRVKGYDGAGKDYPKW